MGNHSDRGLLGRDAV